MANIVSDARLKWIYISTDLSKSHKDSWRLLNQSAQTVTEGRGKGGGLNSNFEYKNK